MKKVITILLVMLFLMNEFSFIAIYIPLRNLARYIQKTNIEKGSDESNISLIVINKNDFENGNHDFYFVEQYEFIYKGEMYDLSSFTIEGDNVNLLCYKDDKETKLNFLLAQYFSNGISDITSEDSSFFNSIIFDAESPISFKDNSSWREDECFYFTFFSIINNFLDIPTPPPKFIS